MERAPHSRHTRNSPKSLTLCEQRETTLGAVPSAGNGPAQGPFSHAKRAKHKKCYRQLSPTAALFASNGFTPIVQLHACCRTEPATRGHYSCLHSTRWQRVAPIAPALPDATQLAHAARFGPAVCARATLPRFPRHESLIVPARP